MTAPRLSAPPPPDGAVGRAGIQEAARLWWRKGASELTLRRDGWSWSVWTAGVAFFFTAPGVLLLWIEPFTFPAAAICFVHAFAVPWIQARRGARQVVPIGGERSGARDAGAERPAERIALGLLGDLVGHEQRELLARTGLVVEPGALGIWALGENGAFLIRSGGRRVDCWCVRIADDDDLPAGDRVAHLLLALREDERGFATVANLGFSGAMWRVRACLEGRSRPALDVARRRARAKCSRP